MGKTTPALMVQGTTSDAGKSVVGAGLCRLLQRNGVAVAPFKPQNMALNSAVTCNGGEIGRAQAVQALAARIEAHTDMNPILLKPNSDTGAQVIINGQAIGNQNAREYHAFKAQIMPEVLAAYERLQQRFAAIVIEGAGSPAEINLRDHDIANMGFACATDTPVVIVADIDRGGVFAHLYGTYAVLEPAEQSLIKGFIINRFRGDPSLLTSGNEWLSERTGVPVLGVLPYLQNLPIDAEDAIDYRDTGPKSADALQVVVPRLRRISNHNDFDALRHHPDIALHIVDLGQTPPPADLIILAGTKSVIADLQGLRDHGWEQHITKHLRYGGKLMGICGGYQMLGHMINDPHGVESDVAQIKGLGLLDFETTLETQKTLTRMNATMQLDGISAAVEGYEIHVGQCHGPALQRPLLQLHAAHGMQPDGVVSEDQQIIGCYLHGVFDKASALQAILAWCGKQSEHQDDRLTRCEQAIDLFADTLADHLDLKALQGIMGLPTALTRDGLMP